MGKASSLSSKIVSVRTINAICIVLAAVVAIFAITSINEAIEADRESDTANEAYIECHTAANNLKSASDYLTYQSRTFVATGHVTYLEKYLKEYSVTDSRDEAVAVVEKYFKDQGSSRALHHALDLSNELAATELYAMRLEAEAIDLTPMPEELLTIQMDSADSALSKEEKHEKAQSMLLSDDYDDMKRKINDSTTECFDDLILELGDAQAKSNDQLNRQLNRMNVFTMSLVFIILISIICMVFFVLSPLRSYTRDIERDKLLKPVGAYELKYLAKSYNHMYKLNRERTEELEQAAEVDALTGLLNRGAYDELMAQEPEEVALVLVDVDHFKDYNDTYGHEVGDQVLKKVADVLKHSFRTTDYVCRLGGDEFVVLVTHITPENSAALAGKVALVAEKLSYGGPDLPPITLSVGIAFDGEIGSCDSLFAAADKALYHVKSHGRNNHAFYQES